MSSLLQLRTKLKTIKGLSSIFSALEVVTVVRLRHVKEPYQAMEHYLQPMREVLAGRLKPATVARKVLVVITSNRGLCGSFNNLVTAKAREFLAQNPGTELVLIGRFAVNKFARAGQPVIFSDAEIVEKASYAKARALLTKLRGLGAEIYFAYNTYKSAVLQIPQLYQLYPLPPELAGTASPAEYILEPTAGDLVESLFDHYLETRLFQVLLDSQMGELSARLMVLKGAIDTSEEITSKLFVQINKARQAAITKDLIEIVSAAEALRKEEE